MALSWLLLQESRRGLTKSEAGLCILLLALHAGTLCDSLLLPRLQLLP